MVKIGLIGKKAPGGHSPNFYANTNECMPHLTLEDIIGCIEQFVEHSAMNDIKSSGFG